MLLTARIRIELARRPWVRWAVVAATGALAWVVVDAATHAVARERAAWGTGVPVVVAVRDVAAGESLAAAAEVRELPSPAVPTAARTSIADGERAARPIAAGSVLTDLDVAGAATDALVPAGWVVVSVREAVPSGALPGDRVLVAADGLVLAAAATVVAVTDDLVRVAVPEGDAALVAAATSSASGAALAVRP